MLVNIRRRVAWIWGLY